MAMIETQTAEPATWLEIRLFNAAREEARRRLPNESELDQLVYTARKLATLLAWVHGYDVDREGAEQMIKEMLATVPTPSQPGVH